MNNRKQHPAIPERQLGRIEDHHRQSNNDHAAEKDRECDQWTLGHSLMVMKAHLVLVSEGESVVERKLGDVQCAIKSKDDHLLELVVGDDPDQGETIKNQAESESNRFED